MRLYLILALASGSAAAVAQPRAAPAAPAGPFLSPMGEPFRGADPVGIWFAGADRDGDGALLAAELREDALRFFVLLDQDRNGELGPAEIARYENDVAPEVQVGLQMRAEGVGDFRDGRRRKMLFYKEGLDGAGRFSFLNIPQPVIGADFDMNRGVSRDEFARAADQRFAMLDKDGDGRIARADLPALPRPDAKRRRSRDFSIETFDRRPERPR